MLHKSSRAWLLIVLAFAVLLTSCGGDSKPGSPTPGGTGTARPGEAKTASATPTPAPSAPAAPAPPPTPDSVGFAPALGGRAFDRPVELGAYPGGSDEKAIYVAEQVGQVFVFHGGAESTLLDIRRSVSRDGNEEGLLSVMPDPAFKQNGHIWAYYSVAGGARRTRLSRFTVDAARDPYLADPATELVILEQPQPFSNHNGGSIRFGPDGMLYLGLGDGGSQGDPSGNGQNLGVLLAKVIRIDVHDASTAKPYAVPPDNPFVGTAGARGEIWAYGLRNPWRMSFDPATKELWVADVGQDAWEEVDVIQRGGDYGWNRMEGFACYKPASNCDKSGLILPIAAYPHSAGCSVSGGPVYRGRAVPSLVGYYLYADYCSGTVWALNVETRAEPIQLASKVGSITSMGTDADGEAYVLRFGGPALRIVAK